jgi:hypothetical protein
MQSADPTADYRGKIYVGRSTKDDDEFSLEAAVKDAYEQAKADSKSGPFRVMEIWFDGDNPLSEYKVAVGSSG